MIGQEPGVRGVVLDQRAEQIDHRLGLGSAGRTQVDVLVVELSELGERFGHLGFHAHPTGLGGGGDHGMDERAELLLACVTAPCPHQGWEILGGDDASGDRIFEVVADVGDAIGPTDHLAFGRGRGRATPGVISDAVERLRAQIEWNERDVGSPLRVIESAGNERRQRVFARVTARTVTAVVAEGDGFGECDVEAERPGHRHGHLGHLERVGEPRALMVVGEHEHLGLAGQTTKRRGVENAIAVAFETGAERVGVFVDGTLAGTDRPRGQTSHGPVELVFARGAFDETDLTGSGPRIGVSKCDGVVTSAGHGAGPAFGPFGDVGIDRRLVHDRQATTGVWQ